MPCKVIGGRGGEVFRAVNCVEASFYVDVVVQLRAVQSASMCQLEKLVVQLEVRDCPQLSNATSGDQLRLMMRRPVEPVHPVPVAEPVQPLRIAVLIPWVPLFPQIFAPSDNPPQLQVPQQSRIQAQ